jgi:DNA-binding GntR family transcriptional regulator
MNAKPTSATTIPRATLTSIVGERIRTSIIDGTLTPGSQLNEVDLAAQFGVSRGPVREALQRLIQEGLLRSEPHRGVFVPVMTEEDVRDIYLVREALETAAVRKIVGSPRAASAFDNLDRLVREMEHYEAKGDWRSVGESDLLFHTALVAAAESPRLERMFNTIISETRLCLSALTAVDARHDLVPEHRTITDRMSAGDIEGALAALTKHFDDAVVTLHNWRAAVPAGDGHGR